jgi:hypothetical protein
MFNAWLKCITNLSLKHNFWQQWHTCFAMSSISYSYLIMCLSLIFVLIFICFESLSFPRIYVYKCSSLSFKTWLFIILWLTEFDQYWLVHIMEHLNNFGFFFEFFFIFFWTNINSINVILFLSNKMFKCCLIFEMDKSKCGYWYIMLMQFLMDSTWDMFFFIFNSVSFNSNFPFIFNLIMLTISLHTSWLEIIGTSITLLH